MAPKTRVKRKAMTAKRISASNRKKRRTSFESVTSLNANSETMLSVTVSPGVEEPAALKE